MPIKILLIEDNPDHILLTERILEKADRDCQFDSAREAEEGLRKIVKKNFDLVICDYRMPDLTALSILKEMKKLGKDLPFVVVTSSGNEKIAVELMKEGAYDYILKDLSYEEILPIVINRSIERYRTKKEKERAEQALRESEEKYRSLTDDVLDTSAVAIFILDKDFRVVWINQVLERYFGLRRQKIVGKDKRQLIREHIRYIFEDSEGFAEKVLATYDNNTYVENFECHVLPEGDRKERWLEHWSQPIRSGLYAGGRIEHYTDITESKKTEKALQDAYQQLKETQQQLIQSAKMAAMGQLAAGVSHELNQPLTGIKGFAQAALMDLDGKHPLISDLNKIVEQADRMDDIIKNVRLFAKKTEFKMEQIDVNKPIEDSLMLLSQQLKVHNIQLKKSLAKNLPKIDGDANQLQQIFLNLITNARDAIDSLESPKRRELIIKTALSKDKKNIEMIFQDTGCGIPKKNLDDIFNPFFTTKSPEGGIGLGLSIVYRIIENHKGSIKVRSKKGSGSGTTFRIKLPVLSTDDYR